MHREQVIGAVVTPVPCLALGTAGLRRCCVAALGEGFDRSSVRPGQALLPLHFFASRIFSPASCVRTAAIRSSVGAKVCVNLPDCNCAIKAVYQQGLGQSVCSDASCYKITSVVQTDTVISASFYTGFLQSWLGVSSDKNSYSCHSPKLLFSLWASSKVTSSIEAVLAAACRVKTLVGTGLGRGGGVFRGFCVCFSSVSPAKTEIPWQKWKEKAPWL